MVNLNFCSCGKIHVPNDIQEAVKRGEKVMANILPQSSGIAKNVLKWSTGGINIDKSRIQSQDQDVLDAAVKRMDGNQIKGWVTAGSKIVRPNSNSGRWPANLILSHNSDCSIIEKGKRSEGKRSEGKRLTTDFSIASGELRERDFGPTYGDEVVDKWECSPGCAVAELDRQSGVRPGFSGGGTKGAGYRTEYVNGAPKEKTISAQYFGDTGGASRFFYCSKPSKSEKNSGCDELQEKEWDYRDNETSHLSPRAGAGRNGPTKNHHPTVKPVKLMKYLINMITPTDGTILDCFGGSGTTLIASHLSGFDSILIEQSTEYCDIILARAEFITGKSAILKG